MLNTGSLSGIGLSTVRGSATSGYVQRNLGHLRNVKPSFEEQQKLYEPVDTQKAPNRDIMQHDAKRAIEVRLAEWAEAQGLHDQR
jgi:hypothetical protein